MSLMDNCQNSTTEPNTSTRSLQMPGLVSQYSSVEQLAFPDDPTPSHEMHPMQTPYTSSSKQTRVLKDPITSPGVTRQLPDMQTGVLAPLTDRKRESVVIRGTRKKRVTTEALPGPVLPKKSRLLMHLGVTSLLVFIMLGTLLAVAPVSRGEGGIGGILSPLIGGGNVKSDNTALLAQQQATATAVTRDGYDFGPNHGQYAGVAVPAAPVVQGPSGPAGDGSGDHFSQGQCTWWASYLYHQETGYWAPWSGNAEEWASGAAASGWVVSSSPHIPSIIVLQPGAPYSGYNHAGPVGHVAVVQSINADGTVHTSNMNWTGWGQTSEVDFQTGAGVQFVWHP